MEQEHVPFRPDYAQLAAVLGNVVADAIAGAPGGWRTLSLEELEALGLEFGDRQRVLALQRLVRRGYPTIPFGPLSSCADVGRVYEARLGGHTSEVLLAVALDGQNNVLGEVELSRGGAHGLAVTPGDVFRPLIRIGAQAFILVHNHPSGDPSPSADDLRMTQAVHALSDIVGIRLLDHVIVGARGGGFVSLSSDGFLEEAGDEDRSDATV